ncbi:MAG: hypothetical protein GXX93_09985 [Anaerolineae bacterium]|nr:hypothetical protein [Anaerolineae bacterium]
MARLIPLLSRLIFLLGGLFLVFFGFAAGNATLMLLLPGFGVYFMAKGAFFMGSLLSS